MVVGTGMMAAAFSFFVDDRRVVIFASGVSNSLETDPGEFEREKNLLTRTRRENPDRLLVYFGTCSVNDPDRRQTPYVVHKLEMETALETSTGPWLVLRVPLAIGPAHRGETLAPFLYNRITLGESFDVWANATRYPIDVVDVFRIACCFVKDQKNWNRRINVALRSFRILDFVYAMEEIVGKRAVYRLVQKGRHYEVHCPEVGELARQLYLDFTDEYLGKVLRKYFGSEKQDFK